MSNPEFFRYLADRFGTPLYIYDLEEVRTRYRELEAELPARSKLLYSLKANPLPALVRALHSLGARAEVSSLGELDVALDAGCRAQSLLYSGPGKTTSEIAAASARGVTWFSCESRGDFARLAAEGRRRRCPLELLLRINPATPSAASLSMTGVSSQFGFEEDAAAAFLRDLTRDEYVAIAGTHVYLGTQARSLAACADALALAWSTAERLAAATNVRFRVVDLGGGFPWPFASAGEAPLEGLGRLLRERLGREPSPERWFESGRYLVASSGTLISRVTDVKSSRGTKFVLLDTGIHQLGGMSGLGRVWRPTLSMQRLASERPTRERVDVVGPLCTPLDFLGRGVDVEALEPGDVVAVPNTGAYGLTASLTAFLSRPAPLEIVYEGERIVDVYRLRGGHEAILASEITRGVGPDDDSRRRS